MLLETFAFLFHTEGTDKVKEDVKSLKETTDQFTESNQELKKGFEELIGVISPLIAAYAGLHNFMNFTEENNQLWMMSQLTDVSARSLSELGFAMAEFGGNAQTASNTIQRLQMNIMQLRRTGGGALAQAAMMYGIGISADPMKQLENIARRFQSLNATQRLDLGRMLGLDQSTILMLSKGVENFRKEMQRAKEYTFIDDKTVERVHEFRKSFAEFSAILGSIGVELAATILPYATDIVEWLRDALKYLKEHKAVIIGIATTLGVIGASLIKWSTIGAALLSPFTQVLAIVAMLAILAEDVYAYFNGMDSVIGDIAKEFPEFKRFLDEIGEAVKDAWSYIKSGELYKDIKEEFNKIKDWWENTPLEEKKTQIKAVLSDSWETITEKILEYSEDIQKVWDKLVVILQEKFDRFSQYMKTDFIKDVSEAWQYIKKSFSEMLEHPFFSTAIEKCKELASTIKDNIVNALDALIEKLKSLTDSTPFKAIKELFSGIFDFFNGLWATFTDKVLGVSINDNVLPNINPYLENIRGMENFKINEQMNEQARQALYQSNAVNNNTQNANMTANVTINVQEGTRETGVAVANGLTDTMGVYARGVR